MIFFYLFLLHYQRLQYKFHFTHFKETIFYFSPKFFRLLVCFTFAVTSQMRGLCAISYLEQVVNICHSPDKFLSKNEIFGSSLTQISRVNIERLFKERRKKEKRLKTFQIISCSAVFALIY